MVLDDAQKLPEKPKEVGFIVEYYDSQPHSLTSLSLPDDLNMNEILQTLTNNLQNM